MSFLDPGAAIFFSEIKEWLESKWQGAEHKSHRYPKPLKASEDVRDHGKDTGNKSFHVLDYDFWYDLHHWNDLVMCVRVLPSTGLVWFLLWRTQRVCSNVWCDFHQVKHHLSCINSHEVRKFYLLHWCPILQNHFSTFAEFELLMLSLI